MSLLANLILNADSYKASHYLQYPAGTSCVSSYIESRGGRFDRTVFFGLQMFIKQYLLTPITRADIDEAEALLDAIEDEAEEEELRVKSENFLDYLIREGIVDPNDRDAYLQSDDEDEDKDEDDDEDEDD